MPEKELSWQRGFSLSRKPSKRPTVRRKKVQGFEFVEDDCQRALHEKIPPTVRAASGNVSKSQRALTSEVDIELQSWETKENDPFKGVSTGTWTYDMLGMRDRPSRSKASGGTPPYLFTSIPPTVAYNSLTQRFNPILTRYNAEYCTIPLTFDLRINPFRYRTDISPEPTFLVHAVMALAGHHIESTSTLSHRHEALQLLRHNLDAFCDVEAMYSMLDTIVILFSLDETQSMTGNWSTHLAGAYTLLEACGGIHNLNLCSRLEAQIGILTWWDAIISLLSREACIFPSAYFNAILSNQAKREWDFFSLCGCPTSLVTIVMRLAHLNARTENGKPSSWRSDFAIDEELMCSIQKLERDLTNWIHVSPSAAFQDEESMHTDRDMMHCSEAWRHGLLLYIYRVFYWSTSTSIPTSTTYRARVIVEHVTSCRDAEMISRQALFPLFLAGCELRDEGVRERIVGLCRRWDERTRYRMFGDAVPLLEEVWREMDEGGKDKWWGMVVDRRKETEEEVWPLKVRLCFG